MTTRVQGGRTATPASPPANNSLQPGELYVEMASPLRLWTGVPTAVTASGVKLILDATAQAAANSSAVQKAGDTMTGPLTLSGAPTQPAQAATKAYADTKVATVAGHPGPDVVLTHTDISDWTPTLAPYALLNAPTFVGDARAVTPAPGDNDTSIATTAFVNTAIAAQPGTVIAPAIPAFKAGQLWWDATGGSLYVGYDDGNTQAYVPATNITLPANVATKTDVATALNNVGRNLIHNSAFTVAQRGAGPWSTDATYMADRWATRFSTSTLTVNILPASDAQRASVGDEAFGQFLSNAFGGTGGANDFVMINQRIENVRRLTNKTVIVSFYANATSALQVGVSIDPVFGAGGTATVPGTGQAVTLATFNSFTRYSVVISVPTAAGKTFGTAGTDYSQLCFWFSSGANNNPRAGNIGVQPTGTVNLWGVQLEIAQPGQTQPTPLEKRDPVYELQQCQRFYRIVITSSRANATGAGQAQSVSTNFAEMRATPVAALQAAGSRTNVTSIGCFPATAYALRTDCSSVAAGDAFIINDVWTLSADL